LSTCFVAASVFATLEKDVDPKFKVLVALVSVLGAMLAGLQTLLRLEERAEKHRHAGSRYGALHREIGALTISSSAVKAQNYKRLLKKLMNASTHFLQTVQKYRLAYGSDVVQSTLRRKN